MTDIFWIASSVIILIAILMTIGVGVKSGSEMVEQERQSRKPEKPDATDDAGLTIWELRQTTKQAMKYDRKRKERTAA